MTQLSPYDAISSSWLIDKCGPPSFLKNTQETNNAALAHHHARIMGRREYSGRSSSSPGRVVWLAIILATLVCGGGLALAQIWRGQDPVSDFPTYQAGGAADIGGGYTLHFPIADQWSNTKGI